MSDEELTIDDDLYVHLNAAKELECGIHLGLLQKATQLRCDEGHLFCAECIVPLTQSNPTIRCPLCRQECTVGETVPYIDRQVRKLNVKCINSRITPDKQT
eukprot:180642_1